MISVQGFNELARQHGEWKWTYSDQVWESTVVEGYKLKFVRVGRSDEWFLYTPGKKRIQPAFWWEEILAYLEKEIGCYVTFDDYDQELLIPIKWLEDCFYISKTAISPRPYHFAELPAGYLSDFIAGSKPIFLRYLMEPFKQ